MNTNSVSCWNEADRGIQSYSEKKLSKCNFVQQKSHMDSFEIETKPPQWGAENKPARDMIRPSKTKIHLNFIQEFNSYRAVNTQCLGYKTESGK
jgi:hypothetical protein